jgi:DNA-binding NarL/FixJ family response regulator
MSELQQFSSQSIRVAVAEATRMSSQLIAGALKRCRNNFDVHALTGNSAGTFQELQSYQPDVAVISAHLEDGPFRGFKVLQQLRASESKTCAVILLDGAERDLVVGAFRAGARGVFCRGDSFRALPKCIRCVHEGQIWASNTELEFLIEIITKLKPMQIHSTGGMALLTSREQDVVRLVADGMRNQEISRKLNLREHTVRNYVFRIFEKLGISSRVELVLYALSGPEWDQAPVISRAGTNNNS